MTQSIFSQVVPLLVAMAVPAPMIKAIRYLLAGRPVFHSLLMIVTWGATFFLILSFAVSLKRGVKKLRHGLLQESAPVVQQSVPVTASSVIKATIHTMLFSTKNALIMFFIMYILTKSEIALEHSLAVSGIIAFTSMIWIAIPLFVYVLAGHDRDRVLESLKQWLMQNNETLIIFIYLFIGISTLSTAIGELMPKLLELFFVDFIE